MNRAIIPAAAAACLLAPALAPAIAGPVVGQTVPLTATPTQPVKPPKKLPKFVTFTVLIDGYGQVTAGGKMICEQKAPGTKSCEWTVPYGTKLTLHPVPTEGNRFVSWYGYCGTASGDDCVRPITTTDFIGAKFKPEKL